MSLAMIIPFLADANDMEAVLEVGRDNSNQSAVSQDKIDYRKANRQNHQ
jgi:hypothetical protein